MQNETDRTEGLARALADAGLIQFGRFAQPDGGVWPVAVHLDWLPSYPDVLRQAARALAPLMDGLGVDRVLAGPGALPVGVALSFETGVPLVYTVSEMRSAADAFAIEGAYDVGHPTVLLSNLLLDAAQAESLTALAGRVGLEVRAMLAVLDLGLGAREALEAGGWIVRSLLTLADALPVLEAAGALPPVMRARVQAWIKDCRNDPACG